MPLGFEKSSKIVTNSSKIEKHSFLPFITFNIISYKYKYNEKTKKKEKVEKTRTISYSSHLDGYIYSYYALTLSKYYEEKLKEKSLRNNVLAFRKLGKSNIDFAKQAFDDIKTYGDCSVIALDFSKFFDTLDHRILKEQWANILNVKTLPNDHYKIYKSITKFATVDRDKIYEYFSISKHNPKSKNRKRICTIEEFREEVRKKGFIDSNSEKKGIPQGSSLSALLSNIYMIDFDEKIKNYVHTFEGKYYRYCDDMLIIAPINRKEEIEKFVIHEISHLNVEINIEKTEKRVFQSINGKLRSDKPIQYLGFIFDGENIFIRPSSISRYYQKMKKGVLLAKKTRDKKNKIREARNIPSEKLYKKKLYTRYSYLGKSNFVSYGIKSKRIMDNSTTIKKQTSRLWGNLLKEIEK
ncbi:MAG: RNA-directed DNA polymerase (Reverse transcriptase) [uncultured Sulfurovum sp.]|uniref:RNA-directed DNA polymerase (Reverse transcriptase) n=1 Tax=uncultured Sulfurovum sp. TaxID=269237 RepID=A0A6S6TAK1_9BACT|nr:MAG: RNA-directed DNA polymerase (Reverse transcriptase) [uncultured Sulfurovum sp.]